MSRAIAGLLLAVSLLLNGCSGASQAAQSRPTVAARTSTKPRAAYAQLVDSAVDDGVVVWVEVDLLKAWLAGGSRYQVALDIAGALARLPGVAGVKIADELGYDDGTTGVAEVQAFLHDAAAALRRSTPARKVMVDLVVPELGCLAWAAPRPAQTRCALDLERKYPAATIAAVDGYLRSGDIDVVNLSAGLRDESTYASWGLTRDDAMTQVWREVVRRGWSREVQLNARKALAFAGRYRGGSAQAERDVHTYVDIPVQQGALGVDIWTWAQPYQGQLVHLTDPGLEPNALTRALADRRAAGVLLMTHMTPSHLQEGRLADLASARQMFRGLILAAGAG